MSACEGNPPVPEGTQPLSHQVAGHVFGTGKTKLGFLQTKDGTILKPIHGCSSEPEQLRRRQTEVDFYQQVFDPNCSDKTLVSLRPFLPKYLGTWTTEMHPGVTYLHLEDVTSRFNKPCIIDAKMGCVTYGPDADPEKISREKLKYPPAAQLGFQFVGMRIFEPEEDDYIILDRTFLRSLSSDELYEKALGKYLHLSSHHFTINVVHSFLAKLQKLETWFNSQRSYCFIASSLLLVYDGQSSKPLVCSNNADEIASLTDVRMIDVNRVHSTTTEDTNYTTGLSTLIRFFQRVIKEQ